MTTTSRHASRSSRDGRRVIRRSVWRTVYLRALVDKSTLVGVLGFYAFAVAVGVGALWLPLQDTFRSIADDFPAAFDALLSGLSLATPAGWMNAELLSIMGPGFLIATAMLSAVSATATEEQTRTLGLVLSTATPRATFLSAKTTAMITHVLIVGVAIFLGMVAANPIGELGLSIPNMAAATVQMVLIALVYGAITLVVGAFTGDKRLSLAVPGGIFAVSFIAASFLGLVDSLEWLSKLNFWYPYLANPALVNGLHWGYASIMAGLAVGIGAIAFVVFTRRGDLHA